MRTLNLALLIFTAGVVSMLTGCVERRTVYVQGPPGATREVIVNEAPPAPQPEVILAAPGPEYIWVPGYWSWQGRWVWVGGAWKSRPHPHAYWVPGHWGHRARGYIWIGGRWR